MISVFLTLNSFPMRNFGSDLLDCLNLIKGNGSFVTTHSAPFVFPGLSVLGQGEIAYPINELQANALIQAAEKAPFGKGSQTIIDETVRRAWEIDAEKLLFNGQQWDQFLQKALNTIKPQLGIEDLEIEARLYKMLVYEKGDFFLSHRDTEKEKGMFGTLIIGLPSKHRGGELLVRFDGEEQCVNLAEEAGNYRIPYVAFYADCEHEIKPMKEGYRVCLVYNLIQKKSEKAIRLEPLGEHVSKLATILKAGVGNRSFSPGIVLLGHQYTPENFSQNQLKLNDRTRATALIRAAAEAEYYAKMCLVTSQLSGIPAYDGYGWDETPDDNVEMGEVYDGIVTIEHWLEEGPPPLRSIEVDEDELLTTFKLNEGDPVEKENTGYMGNYGPDLMHWYHYGAIVFWSKEYQEEMLLREDIPNQLEWLGYYNTKRRHLSGKETAICESILKSLLNKQGTALKAQYHVIADWVTGSRDETTFKTLGYPLLKRYFQQIQPDYWVKLVETYPSKHFDLLFRQIGQQGNVSHLHHLLEILIELTNMSNSKNLLASQIEALPEYFSNAAQRQEKPLVNGTALTILFNIEKLLPQQKEWVDRMVALLCENNERKYINEVLVPVVLNPELCTSFSKALLSFTKKNLQYRVDNKPQPPANWSRPVPKKQKNLRIWKLLESFLESPVEQVFDFRKNKQERTEMEDAIADATVDLRTETIRKGSPYTLRLFKTEDAYDKQIREWYEDVVLLEQVKKMVN